MSDKGKAAGDGFQDRRMAAKRRLDDVTGSTGGDPNQRQSWFEAVYDTAGGDPAAVPWADLAPKPELCSWLARHPGGGRRALDVACGLGDNAEAIAAAGYRTTAFDLAAGAVDWARRRFPQSLVDYRQADLFAPPADWSRAFDLVCEIYTVQAMRGEMRRRAPLAIADFVAPGGVLLVLARSRRAGAEASGPPWPLEPSEVDAFAVGSGLTLESLRDYAVERSDRTIPHVEALFRRKI